MASETLCHRAEVFRSKLIEDFQMLESISEQGRKKAPVYTSAEITKPGILDKILLDNPEQMIKFKVYKQDEVEQMDTNVDRRLNRVKNHNTLPVGVWASWVVETPQLGVDKKFQTVLLLLVILNGITIGIEGELPVVTNDTWIIVLKVLLEFIDSFSVIVFATEIILKWIDNFRNFWSNPWNIFDFIVTTASAIPLVIVIFTNDDTTRVALQKLSVFRILRALKMIAQFGGLKIIVLTLLQAFQSMLFIVILLSVVTYIFAIAGVIFFEAYTNSERNDLQYQNSFSTLLDATITLFRLFTLDQWYNIYNDLIKVIHPAFACTYILLWVWIGAFVFRNLFVGIIVNNFQSISEELVRKKQSIDRDEELAIMKEELNIELTRHSVRMSEARKSLLTSKTSPDKSAGTSEDCNNASGAELRQQISQLMLEEEKISKGWDETVRSHLEALASNPVETLWPRDTLFKYYQLMEQLQENLDEYDKLQKLANEDHHSNF